MIRSLQLHPERSATGFGERIESRTRFYCTKVFATRLHVEGREGEM